RDLLAEPAMCDLALNGLAQYEDASIPPAILAHYKEFGPTEKQKAIAALSSRAGYAIDLLKAIQDGTVPKTDLSADLVRQMHNLKNEEISDLLTEIWGQVRTSAADKLALMV